MIGRHLVMNVKKNNNNNNNFMFQKHTAECCSRFYSKKF